MKIPNLLFFPPQLSIKKANFLTSEKWQQEKDINFKYEEDTSNLVKEAGQRRTFIDFENI